MNEAIARIEALMAERDEALEWLSASQGYIADAVFALDRAEKAAADNALLREALNETAQILSQCTFETIRVRGQYIDRREAISRARAALNAGKEPSQ
jgi:hypothetical protein